MDAAAVGLGLAAIAPCAEAWKDLRARIAHRFARSEARDGPGTSWWACWSKCRARTDGEDSGGGGGHDGLAIGQTRAGGSGHCVGVGGMTLLTGGSG